MSHSNAANMWGSLAMWLGFTISLPQIYVSLKYKKFEGLSVMSYILAIIVNICWIIYGYMIDAKIVVVSGVLSIFTSLIIVCTYYKYKDHPELIVKEEQEEKLLVR